MKSANAPKGKLRWTMLIALSLAVTTAVGCSNTPVATPSDSVAPSASTEAGSKLDPVELIWYYPQNKANTDLQLVNDEVNKITKEKINATVKLQPVDFANYEQKLNTIVAANEAIDIIWTSSWLFNWVANVNKGAFQPIDDLLKSHGQKLFQSMPEKFWNDGKMNGKMYAVPNYQVSAQRPGLVIAKRFVDKYKLDISTEPFLKQIKEGEPGITPFGTTRGFYTAMLYGIDTKVPVYLNDTNHKVLPDVTEEMKQNFKLAHSWYTKGYINEDAATLKNAADAYNKGTTAVWFDFTGKPGSEVEFKAANGGHDVVLVPLAKSVYTGAVSTMNAISRTSKNPERAMMFLELVNTDKQLYNILVYGIEGKHYTKTTGNFIKINQDAGYFTNLDWVFGNISNEYLPEGAPADKIAQTIKVNDEAAVSPYYSFTFNTEPVKTELANVKAVNDEYYAALATGTLNPDEYLPVYEEKLKKAGSDIIVAEKQKQLDEWLKANGKK
jgi:putative aldouronate transport system substrate-binding protein